MNISELPYIVARAPMKYGGQQEDYQRRTRDLIAWGARQIKTTPKEEKALVELFFRLIETFSRERQQIARDHRTPKAEQFGRRRDLEGKKDFYHTILDDVYKDYNPKILTFLAERMRDMSLEKKSPVKKSKKLEETYFERLSSIEIEIFENEELARLKWLSPVSLEELPRDFPAHLWEKREKQGDLSSVDWQTLKQGLKKLKEGFPDLYKRLKMSALLLEVQKEFPSPQKIPQPNGSIKLIGNEKNLKSFFVLGTARMPVKGKQYAITQFFTWLYRDFQTHPVDRMLKQSTVMVIHQDNFLIDDTLQEIALIFAKAVLTNKDNLEELKLHTGLVRHYMANNMSWERGAASIGELVEGSVYGSVDLEATYDKEQQIDLAALTSPLLSLFMKAYESMIHLKPIIANSGL